MISENYENIYSKFFKIAKKDGYSKATRRTISWIANRYGLREFDDIQNRRIEISKHFDRFFKSTVQYGPFKGLKLSPRTWWGETDRASMLFGLYEKEVLDSLQNIPKRYKIFIDLGAADGYYAIGVLANNLFERSICFEISDQGQKTIEDNAKLNNVLDRIEIRGKANKKFYDEFKPGARAEAVLFVDIEGAEFDLIDKETFHAFHTSIIFIELHDWFFADGEEKVQRMKRDSSSTHVTTELTMGARDPSVFSELIKLHDNDRWLICSEGRGQRMTWLRFDPKPN